MPGAASEGVSDSVDLSCAPRAGEPPGDPIQRLTLRCAFLAFYGAGVLAVVGGPIPVQPGAHARAMSGGFATLFVLSFLCRMVPRATRTPLRRPRLGGVGAVLLLFAALADVAGAAQWAPPVLGALWLGATVCWTASLGATWLTPRAQRPWFGGWIGGGLVALAACGVLAAGSALVGWQEGLARVPAGILLGGLTPIALGLSVKMLPSLGGVGPARRESATVPPLLVATVGVSVVVGVVAADPFFCLLGELGLLALAVAALRAAGWLRLRDDGTDGAREARRHPDVRSLRWSGRFAWACLGVGLAVLLVSHGAQMWGIAAVGTRSPALLDVIALHIVGVGFLVALMLGVGQRLLPGFVRADVRWPAVRDLPLLLVAAALGARVLAALEPTQDWALSSAAWLLLGAVALVHLQVAPTIRAPG